MSKYTEDGYVFTFKGVLIDLALALAFVMLALSSTYYLAL